MIDIDDIRQDSEHKDFSMFSTVVRKAGNLLSVQLGDLEYLQDFGVDKRSFLQSELQFPNESWQAYCVQRLAEFSIPVTSVMHLVSTFFEKNTFSVGEPDQNSGGLVL